MYTKKKSKEAININHTVSIVHRNKSRFSAAALNGKKTGAVSIKKFLIYKLFRIYSKLIRLITGKKLLNVNDYIARRPIPELKISESIKQSNLAEIEEKLQDVKIGYQTKCVLASGGQGVINNAVDSVLHRTVAMKSLKKEFQNNPVARSKFITEALVTASLEHSAIVPIYSLNSDEDNGLHLAMKKIRGKALRTYLQEVCKCYEVVGIEKFDEESSLQYRLEIFLRVCDAVAYAHRKGIVHCDLKPENIMLNEYHEVYVMDWGIARRIGEKSPEKVTGTVRYLPPETLQKVPADIRMDVYTLGVILYELVTLNFAFDGENTDCIVAQIYHSCPSLMQHRFYVRIKKDLIAIIKKAMAQKPEIRYENAGLLAADLRAFMRDGETVARPDNIWRRYRRWSRRHHKLLAVINTLLFVLLCTAGFCWHYYHKAVQIAAEQRDGWISSAAFEEGYYTGQLINERFILFSDIIQNSSEQISLLLSNDVHSRELQEHLVNVETFVSNNKKNLEYTDKQDSVDISKAVYMISQKKYTQNHYETLNQLLPAYNVLRNAFFSSYKSGLTNQQQKQVFEENKVPISSIYFALNNGLLICYPGNGDVPNNYNMKRRILLNSARGRRIGWSLPYFDVSKSRKIIFTGFRNILVNGKKCGLAALDVPFDVLEQEVANSNPAASRYTVYRRLLNNRGEILLDLQGGEKFICMPIAADKKWQSGKIVKLRFWKDKDKYLKQVFYKKYGSFIATESGQRYIYVFCRVSTLNLFYIEKLKLEQYAVIRHIE